MNYSKINRHFFQPDGSVFTLSSVMRKVKVASDDVVLDLGAHIGMFSLHVLDRGCRFVRAVEMEPVNCARYRLNLIQYDGMYDLVEKAVVSDSCAKRTIAVYSRRKSNAWDTQAYSVAPYTCNYESQPRMQVETVKLAQLMDGVTVLKVDVEGAEYELGFEDALANVRIVAVEFHGTRPQNGAARLAKARSIIAKIESQGFYGVWSPRLTQQNTGEGVWIRR